MNAAETAEPMTLIAVPEVGDVAGYRAIQWRFYINGVESFPFSWSIDKCGEHAEACFHPQGWLSCAIDPAQMQAAREELRRP